MDGGAARKSESSGARRVGVMMWACEAGGQGGLGVSTWAGALAGQRHESSGMNTEDRAWRGPQAAAALKGRHRKCTWTGQLAVGAAEEGGERHDDTKEREAVVPSK